MKERRTKIMVTVADTRCTETFVRSMQDAGADGVRINSAHVDDDTFTRMVTVIRRTTPCMEILMDTKGPEIRTTDNEHHDRRLTLIEGESWQLGRDGKCRKGYIGVNVDPLALGLKGGETILLDDGALELKAERIGSQVVEVSVLRGGELGSRKTVAIPGCDTHDLPPVSDRDARCIRKAKELGVDIIAHSFVRNAADIRAVRELLGDSPIKVYAKIECRDALQNLTEIMEEADGLLIARGDLGAQIDFTSIPVIQHKIALLCRKANKPTILATQMMQSMIENPLPTRAEVSDIATAVMERIGTLLLTGETAQGKYPRECVEIMRRTIETTENYENEI